MRRSLLARVFAAVLCYVLLGVAVRGVSSGQPTGERQPAAADAPVSPGDVHLKSSRVYIHVGKTGLGHEHAVAGLLQSGSLHVGADENAGSLVFNMGSFAADGDAARRYIGLAGSTDASTRQQVDANMLGPAVLNVARFPTATLKFATSKPLPDKSRRGLPQYQLNGQLTLHGVSRPIQLIADAESQNGWTHLRGGTSILQSQFGIQPFTKAFGAIGVADQLTIWGDFWIAETAMPAGAGPGDKTAADRAGPTAK